MRRERPDCTFPCRDRCGSPRHTDGRRDCVRRWIDLGDGWTPGLECPDAALTGGENIRVREPAYGRNALEARLIYACDDVVL